MYSHDKFEANFASWCTVVVFNRWYLLFCSEYFWKIEAVVFYQIKGRCVSNTSYLDICRVGEGTGGETSVGHVL